MSFFKALKKRLKKRIQRLAAEDYGDFVFKNNETFLSNNVFVAEDCFFKNTEFIQLGKDVIFGKGSKVVAINWFPFPQGKQHFDPFIKIGNGVQITANLQLSAMKEIIIEDNVLFANNVFIADGFHGYDRIDIPYKNQLFSNLKPIHIGEGSWIGQNVVILPGVTIGKFSIIGANSVVTKSIPDYSIAAGLPARVIKKWDFENSKWIEVKQENKNLR
jgi:acetyltransferase-like isoleucine patch superfamily enzyme